MAKQSLLNFLKAQYRNIPPPQHVDLTGKTVVVVGANTGIGFEAAKHFATMNPERLILACRNQAKGDAALEKLRSETGYNGAHVWIIDLADYQSVLAFIKRFETDGGRLDILVENAAVSALSGPKTTTDGIEEALQVNYLSLALLALALLPTMLKTAQDHKTAPRVVMITSDAHFSITAQNTKDLCSRNMVEYLSGEEGHILDPQMRYGLTKLFNIMFVRELNAQLPVHSPTIITDSVNPGLCSSDIFRDASGVVGGFFWVLVKLVGKTAEQGSRQLVYAALGGKNEEIRGAYISGGEIAEASDFVLSKEGEALQKQLWSETLTVLVEIYPPIQEIVDRL